MTAAGDDEFVGEVSEVRFAPGGRYMTLWAAGTGYADSRWTSVTEMPDSVFTWDGERVAVADAVARLFALRRVGPAAVWFVAHLDTRSGIPCRSVDFSTKGPVAPRP